MKTLSVREFRNALAGELRSAGPLLIRRHSRNVAVVYPLAHPAHVPLEIRQSIVDAFGHELEVTPRWPVANPVIEVYKRDVDRTLIRDNLRRTPDERLRNLQRLQEFAEELRKARR